VLLSMAIHHAGASDLKAEDVVVPSPSGGVLKGWLIGGRLGMGLVVVLHGVHASRSSMVSRLRQLSDAGYSMLAIDFAAALPGPAPLPVAGSNRFFPGSRARSATDLCATSVRPAGC
jgi:hypothetical protein